MKKIPVMAAEEISKVYNYDQVIVIGFKEDESGCIATYGKNKKLCNEAGMVGKALGRIFWPKTVGDVEMGIKLHELLYPRTTDEK